MVGAGAYVHSVAGGSFHFVHSLDMCPNSPHCQQRGRPFPFAAPVLTPCCCCPGVSSLLPWVQGEASCH
jgi:hypothetical protein